MRFIGLIALLGLASPALAQDHAGHDMGAMGAAPALPAACASAMPAMEMAGEPGTMAGTDLMMDEAHAAMMATMDPMHDGMAAGMMAEDIDVAFICGMIPHHRGAIDMARVVLQYGDDPFAREMAERVIAAQEAEIAELTAWLEQQGHAGH